MLVKSGDAAKCSRLQLPDDGINVKRFDRPKKYLGIIFKSIKPIFGQSKRVHGKISGNMACPKSLYVESGSEVSLLEQDTIECVYLASFKFRFRF